MKVIDLFAGLGGFSEGARSAGATVVWAGNHWPAAVQWHAANHPEALHVCQDLHQADWSTVPAHDVLLASPACQGHSRARGKERPHHDSARSTAWAVVSAAEVHRPPVVVVENVVEFTRWALYKPWSMAMGALGYTLAPQVIDAADCGVPQHRKRIFIVCSQSHALLNLNLPRHQHVPADSMIDWDAGRWSLIERPGRSKATLARVARGRAVHGSRFLMAYYGNEKGGRSIHRPIGTLTTRSRWALVDDARMRMLSAAEARRGMGFPDTYQLPGSAALANHLLGNAVCPPVATAILREIRRAA